MGLSTPSDEVSYSLPEFAALFAEIGDRLRVETGQRAVFDALGALAVALVPGAEYAGVTVGAADRFTSKGATDEVVLRVDRIQYELQSGPCVAAARHAAVYNSPEIATDERWLAFGQRARSETGIRSMYAARLFIESDNDLIAALNFYSREPDAFGPYSEAMALILATHGAYVIAHSASRERVENLERALDSNRDIGVAIGVLMNRHQLSREQSFNLLKLHSQRSHVRISDLVADVISSGTLPAMPRKPPTPPR